MIDPSLYPLRPEDEKKPDDSINRLFVNRKDMFWQAEGPELPQSIAAQRMHPGISYVHYVDQTGKEYNIELRSGDSYTMPPKA